MQSQFAEARKSADPEAALKKVIESYVRSSPRLQHIPIPTIARQLRELFHYVARHPDAIVETRAGKAYCDSIKANHLLLGRSIAPEDKRLLEQYTPSRRDAMDLLGDQFHGDDLRVHIGELFKMGCMDEKEYDRRMGREETPGSLKRRFITIGDFVPMGVKRGFISESDASRMLAGGNRNDPLTIGHFKEFHQIMPQKNSLEGYYNIDDAAVVDHMSMSHYLFGGIIPQEELVPIAQWLGYKVSDDTVSESNKKKIANELHQQGFYEHLLTIGDIRQLTDHYQNDSRFDLLRKMLDIDTLAQKHSERLTEHCKNRLGFTEKSDELSLSQVGVPYEKGLAEAVVTRTISFAEFFRIAVASGAITNPSGATFKTRNHQDIILEYNRDNPEQSIIKIKQAGFHARTGYTRIPYAGRKGVDVVSTNGEPEKYWQFTVGELIASAQAAYTDYKEKSKYYRVFDAMLYHAAQESGAVLHDVALKELGLDRLVQIEKDFSHRHYLRWHDQEGQPSFTSALATIHVRRHLARKHLGEIATLETCQKLLEGNGGHTPQNAVIHIANHDHSIKQDEDNALHLTSDIIRQRPDYKQPIEEVHAFLNRPDARNAINLHPTFKILKEMAQRENIAHLFQRDAKGYGGDNDRNWEDFIRMQKENIEKRATLVE